MSNEASSEERSGQAHSCNLTGESLAPVLFQEHLRYWAFDDELLDGSCRWQYYDFCEYMDAKAFMYTRGEIAISCFPLWLVVWRGPWLVLGLSVVPGVGVNEPRHQVGTPCGHALWASESTRNELGAHVR